MTEEDEILDAIEKYSTEEENKYYESLAEEAEILWQEWIEEEKKNAEKLLKEFYEQDTQTFDKIIEKYSSTLVGLRGESYEAPTKMIFYSVIANQLKHNTFVYDNNEIDLRIPLMIFIKAGYGKKNYTRFIKETITRLGKQYVEPTSYHPEQFVGKVVTREVSGDVEYLQIQGFLGSDYLLIDEGHILLTEKKKVEYQECLKYIRTALDPIGSNEIEKRQVNVPHEYRLRYFPDCTISIFSQPITDIDEDLLLKGSLRRFLIVIVDVTREERRLGRRQGKFLPERREDSNKIWEEWINFNKTLMKRKVKFVIDRSTELIDDYIDNLLDSVETIHSTEAREFADSIQYNLKFLIFKMAAIRAVISQPSEIVRVTKENIKKAIQDHKAMWIPQINWITRQMVLKSDKPKGWNDELHGWIMRNLQKKKTLLQKEIVKKYREKTSLSASMSRNKVSKAIKDLVRWNMVEEMKTGNRNEKAIKIKSKYI